MRARIAPASPGDLERAEELTVRTHQLNATGYTYSYDELDRFRQDAGHALLIVDLEDRYGSYGNIGLVLLEQASQVWNLKLLLMSCRVMNRGIGTLLLNHVMYLARQAGVRLLAEFVPTPRNRMMYVAYRFAGFEEFEQRGQVQVLEGDLSRVQPPPTYIELLVES